MEEELKINIIPTASANSESMGPSDLLKKIFAKFDANGDGKMSNSEMKELLLPLFPVSTEEVDRAVIEMDGDGDGVIRFGEFIGFLSRKEEIRYANKCYAPWNSRGLEQTRSNRPPLAPAVTVPGTHEVNNLLRHCDRFRECSVFFNKEVSPAFELFYVVDNFKSYEVDDFSLIGGGEDMEKLEKAFGRFDTDGDGKISAMGLKSVLSSLGRVISLEEAQRITAEIDKDGDGHLKVLAGLFRKRDIRIDIGGPSVFDPIPEANALTDNYEKWMKWTEILLPITASGAYATASILSKATSAAGFIACVMVMLLRATRWEAKAAAKVLAKFAAAACVAAVLTSLANDLPRDYAWIVVVLAFVIPLGAVSFA